MIKRKQNVNFVKLFKLMTNRKQARMFLYVLKFFLGLLNGFITKFAELNHLFNEKCILMYIKWLAISH